MTLRSKDPFHLQQMEDLEKRYKRIAAEVEEVAEFIFCCLLSYMNCRIRLFDLYSYVTLIFFSPVFTRIPCLSEVPKILPMMLLLSLSAIGAMQNLRDA